MNCDGTKCQECATERQDITMQNHRDVDAFMQKHYSFNTDNVERAEEDKPKPPSKNPFIPLASELTENKDNESPPNIESTLETTLESNIKFARLLRTGDLNAIFDFIDKAQKETPQQSKTAHFQKNKNTEELNIKAFENAVKHGYFTEAMHSLNQMYREIEKQEKKNRRSKIHV